jgi:sodium/potassium/calcium exchanger 6
MMTNSHRFHTKVSFILTVATCVLLATLSVLFGHKIDKSTALADTDIRDPSHHHDIRWLEDTTDDDSNNNNNNDGDYSRFSCRYIYDQIPDAGEAQCQFARTCNGGDGVWAPWVFCAPLGLGVWSLFLILSPVMMAWMVTLFRLLGSTAEDYFSPSLEMFSVKLGLPPRFAGVTLLALGNGAADVSSTMSAIVSDEENGYKLSLGALTGAAMLVGGVVSGIVILVADGVTCRGALVRDVTALSVTIAVVWANLTRGVIMPGTITLFLSLYAFFVLIVLVADIYHRAVVVPRLAAAEAAAAVMATGGATLDGEAGPASTTNSPNIFQKFVTAFSNYDNPCEQDTTLDPSPVPASSSSGSFNNGASPNSQEHLMAGSESGLDLPAVARPETGSVNTGSAAGTFTADEHFVLHGQHGILHGDGQVPASFVDSRPLHAASNNVATNTVEDGNGTGGGGYTLVEDHIDHICVGDGADGIQAHNWTGALHDGRQEVKASVDELWEDIAFNADLKAYEKFLLVCEFPFTLFRKASIPIPCEGYYNRGFIALSVALSPLWFAWYMLGHEINMFAKGAIFYFAVYWAICIGIGAMVLRFAPAGEGNMAMIAATPIALYGFVMAATWIDYIADHLVSLLDFMGIVLHIPGSIMGLTVLAWGNSMGDLSANMCMARKGLANMAMTACFAGPVFNILVGLGLGFSNLQAQTGKHESSVALSAPIVTGFIFVVVNCVAILVTGTVVGKGMIQPYYGYIAVGLYGIYVVTSIALEFR